MKVQHWFYGYLAGITNAAALQPLQNIKMALMIAPKDLKLSNNFLYNLSTASKYLWNNEKVRGFYKGLVPNVLKTGFSSAVYFYSLRSWENVFNEKSLYNSFLVSSLSRIASAITANPFAVIETRFQMAGADRWEGTMIQSFKKVYKIQGMRGFFKGCFASCIKEGSFAGLYYALYTEGKKIGISSSVSGMTAGLISTIITHPFEIIRAHLQVDILGKGEDQLMKVRMGTKLMNLMREGDLLKGVAPRLIKKPLANTIAFLIFQTMENKNRN